MASKLKVQEALRRLAQEPEVFDDPTIYLPELRRLEALGLVSRPTHPKKHVRPFVTPAGVKLLKDLN